MTNNIGRPRIIRPIETLKFNTYQSDITIFRTCLYDSLEDDEEERETKIDKDAIRKFLDLDIWRQNLFIVYILNRKSNFSFKELAELLQVDRNELRREINSIKKEIRNK